MSLDPGTSPNAIPSSQDQGGGARGAEGTALARDPAASLAESDWEGGIVLEGPA